MAIILTRENFVKEVEESALPIVIDAYAVWCGPCQMMLPIFEELSKEMSSKYKFAKLNIDELRDVAIKYGISSVPTFLFIKDGKLVKRETGFINKDSLRQKIESAFE